MSGRFEDKIVAITGAGSGMGRECARAIAAESGTVVVMDVSSERADAVAAEITADGGRAIASAADVADEDEVRAAMARIGELYGRLDVLMANAGIAPAGFGSIPFEETTLDSWNRIVGVNLTGVFLSCKHAVPLMRPGSAIVVTSSAGAFISFPGMAIYSATKGGVNGLVMGLSLDLGAKGIRINAVCPMFGMSPNFALPGDAPVVGRSYEEDRGPWDPAQSPMPLKLDRPPALADNAAVAMFLASDASMYLSGACIPSADGGIISRAAFRVEPSALASELHPALKRAHESGVDG